MIIRKEFDKRCIEINSFYEILEIIELEKPKINASKVEDGNIDHKVLEIDNPKIDTLRSTTYLLLYNLIESTIYNSIISIFDQIEDQGLKYFDIIEDLQKYWLNNLYKHDDRKKKETIIETIMSVAVQIFNKTITLSSNEINYGGSLDVRAIFETAKSVKMDIKNVMRIYKENRHGLVFKNIKQKRNWLAHGEKSFIDVGNTSSYALLDEYKGYVFAFLSEYITAVEVYIENQKYKKVNQL